MSDEYLRLASVIAVTGLARSSLYRLIGEGCSPKQVSLTRRTVRWKVSVVQRWLDDPGGFREER